MSDDEGRIACRVRIGVTGHRDLGDPDGLAVLVRERLREIRDTFPPTATTAVVFELLSSLAEGADRLVVQEAASVLADARLELHAVLPRTAADYERDFATPESRDEFAAMLAGATACDVIDQAVDRDDAYERAGCFVVDHSDLVIALWDRREAGGRGGTAGIVRYAWAQSVPVVEVPATRTTPTDRPAVQGGLTGARRRREAAPEAYRRIAELNRESVRDGALRRELEAAHGRLAAAATDPAISGHAERVAAWALPRLVRADALALKYQHWHYRLAYAIYALAAAAVSFVAVRSHDLAPGEVACMVALFFAYTAARRLDPHGRWLGYRSLAEAFRWALFVVIAGVRDRDGDATDGEAGEPWFQRAFSEAWGAKPDVVVDPASAGGLRDFLIDAWLNDQIRYHTRTARRLRRSHRHITAVVIALFAVTFVVGLLHMLHSEPEESESSLMNLFVFLALALPAWGAALTGMRDERQHRLHAERSRRTAARLQGLRRQLAAQTELPQVQQTALQIQRAIEAEKLDWWSVSEVQEIEIVV